MSHVLPMRCTIILAILLSAIGAQAALLHRWSFNEAAGPAPAGTTYADTVSGTNVTVRGNGAALKGRGQSVHTCSMGLP
jgi:hypothetical protein